MFGVIFGERLHEAGFESRSKDRELKFSLKLLEVYFLLPVVLKMIHKTFKYL